MSDDRTDLDEQQQGSDAFLDDRKSGKMQKAMHISEMFQNWFLEYASYVILDRSVPEVKDGLKPVHRRILHSMYEMDDGRYNKVANIIGNTMKYHPHGDASIGEALVNMGQRELLIDMQGNWGDVFTGDSAAAPRYIEARLSKFALAVVFNPKTTEWKASYDGRNKEPVHLPVKFPLLLAQGAEGIAVVMRSKILPHNFNELIEASIAILRNKPFELYPDFQTGGLMDASRYNDGKKGSRVRVRARIVQESSKLLKITDLPYSKTTGKLIESILSANEKGKIKIKKVFDNTSDKVEILLHLGSGVSPDQTIDALYAFTDCEVSIASEVSVIQDEKPHFFGVSDILRLSTQQTVALLQKELEIKRAELLEQKHQLSLEKIFIEERIYRQIEECESFEEVISTIDIALKPFVKDFVREVSRDDIMRLTEIRIKRISKYNSFKADEQIKAVEEDLSVINYHLAHLVEYAIDYFKDIKKRFGKGRERRTELRSFETIDAATVAVANTKLYMNREDGFVGTSLKKDEFVCECSDIDDIIVFLADGTFMVTKVSPKSFVGKDIIHVEVFNKNDVRTTYNMVYRDGRQGNYYVKRFNVTSITRERSYSLTKGAEGSKVYYFTANPNGEAEVVRVYLRPHPRVKKQNFEYDFKDLAIKGRSAKGNIFSKHTIRKIVVKEDGVSTLGAVDIWFDNTVQRLNTEERGQYLGAFKADDQILTIMQSGHYQLYNYDVSNHFDDDMIYIAKFQPETILSVLYRESATKLAYLKRFQCEDTDKKQCMVGDEKGKLIDFSLDYRPQLKVEFAANAKQEEREEIIDLEAFIGVKSVKAKGKRISNAKINTMAWAEPLPYEPIELETEVEEKKAVEAVDFEIHLSDQQQLVDKKQTEANKDKKSKNSDTQISMDF